MGETLLAPPAPERQVLTVTELTRQIKDLLEGEFPILWVRGEISNFKRHTSGHWYFTLKDEGAQLRCACFRYQNRTIRFSPEDGLEVFARGRLSVYERRGEYQLIVELMEPVGVGSLQLAFEQLKKRLQAEGLFDPAHKKPLPLFPRKVGVVTSPTGAAIRDILRVLKRRNSGVSVLIYPVRVQGEGAAQEIAKAIRVMNEREDLDVLIVGRGGGSIEDLWAFNEESVARAIFNSDIPIISAVGHEIDFTIADFVADLRAPTPSAAAEQVAARRDELQERVASLGQRLIKAMHLKLTTLRHRLAELQARRGFDRSRGLLREHAQRLDDLHHRLQTAMRAQLQRWRDRYVHLAHRMAGLRLREYLAAERGRLNVYENRLAHGLRRQLEVARQRLAVAAETLMSLGLRETIAQRRGQVAISATRLHNAMSQQMAAARQRLRIAAGKLDALSPLAVLSRGYAIVWGPQGTILRRASEVSPGDRVRIRLHRGQLRCTTEEVITDDRVSERRNL